LTEALIFAPGFNPVSQMVHDTGGSIQVMNAGSTIAFEQMFRDNFKALNAYACTILKDEATAEEMVQNVFCKLWEKKDQVQTLESNTAYLYKSVYYECLNYIKHTKVKAAYRAHANHTMSEKEETGDSANLRQLQQKLHDAMNDLPEQCRAIFQMSRFEELKYREIKTVENQMGKALRIMREKLSDFLPIFIFLFLNL
jgi:RNA polymerase sigma-70 factor, ECF subfamily